MLTRRVPGGALHQGDDRTHDESAARGEDAVDVVPRCARVEDPTSCKRLP